MNRFSIALMGAAVLILALSGCASTRLAGYEFDEQAFKVDVRVAPDADVNASAPVTIDMEDPVKTAFSIGSSLAVAAQAGQAEARLADALRETDIQAIVEEQIGNFMESTFDATLVDRRSDADFHLMIDVEGYGIDVGSFGSGVEFFMSATATLWDLHGGDRIWRTRESVQEPVSPDVFGLSEAAGNVLSAVALAELSEEEITYGLERLARDAAWDIGLELEEDIYRARRRQ